MKVMRVDLIRAKCRVAQLEAFIVDRALAVPEVLEVEVVEDDEGNLVLVPVDMPAETRATSAKGKEKA